MENQPVEFNGTKLEEIYKQKFRSGVWCQLYKRTEHDTQGPNEMFHVRRLCCLHVNVQYSVAGAACALSKGACVASVKVSSGE